MKLTLQHHLAVLLLTGNFCLGENLKPEARYLRSDIDTAARGFSNHTFSINADSLFRFGAQNGQGEIMGEKRTFPGMRDGAGSSTVVLQSPLADNLGGLNWNIALGGVIDNLDSFGATSILGMPVNDVQLGLGTLKWIKDSAVSLHTIVEHPNDPGSRWEGASLGLNLFSFVSSAEFVSPALGQITTLVGVVKTMGEATRSRVLENRAERLLFTGGMPLQLREFHERLGTYDGSFSFKTSEITGRGQYELRHSSDRLFERKSIFDATVSTHMENLRMMNDSMLSGDFIRKERRVESGAAFWNLYRTTSTEINQHSTDHYQISFDGSKWQQPGNSNEVLHVGPPDFLLTRPDATSGKPGKKALPPPFPEPPKKPFVRNEPPVRNDGPGGGGSAPGNEGGVSLKMKIGASSFQRDPKLDRRREELLRKRPQ